MLFPIRCYTCGKVLGNKSEKYKELVDAGTPHKEIFEKLGVSRYCCIRIFLGHEPRIFETMSKYKRTPKEMLN